LGGSSFPTIHKTQLLLKPKEVWEIPTQRSGVARGGLSFGSVNRTETDISSVITETEVICMKTEPNQTHLGLTEAAILKI